MENSISFTPGQVLDMMIKNNRFAESNTTDLKRVVRIANLLNQRIEEALPILLDEVIDDVNNPHVARIPKHGKQPVA